MALSNNGKGTVTAAQLDSVMDSFAAKADARFAPIGGGGGGGSSSVEPETITFPDSNTIVETFQDKIKTTVTSGNTVTETTTNRSSGAVTQTVTTTFNNDGSITVAVA